MDTVEFLLDACEVEDPSPMKRGLKDVGISSAGSVHTLLKTLPR